MDNPNVIDNELIEKVTRALWLPFLEQIGSKHPICFCFYGDMVADTLGKVGLNPNNPIELINKVARQLLIVTDSEVNINEYCFNPIWGNSSPAIILICQHVLAVEEMTATEEGFTDQAYFPHLRKFISSKLEVESLNPLSSLDFESIWRQFRDDILSLGGTSKNISFKLGIGEGINKSRILPFSQALLSIADIRRIVTLAQLTPKLARLDKISLSDLHSIRHKISRRGSRVLSQPWLKDKVLSQITSYLLAFEGEIFPSEIEKKDDTNDCDSFEMRIYVDDDIFSQALSSIPMINGTKADEKREEIEKSFLDEIETKGFLVLPYDQNGGFWYFGNVQYEVNCGREFLLFSSITNKEHAVQTLCNLSAQKILDLNEIPFTLSSSIIAMAFPNNWKPEKPWRVGLGKIFIGKGAKEQPLYAWEGGLALDANGLIYSKFYPPTKLIMNGKEVSFEDKLDINGRITNLREVFNSFSKIDIDHKFEIKIGSNALIELKILAPKRLEEKLGYEIDDYLSPYLTSITDSSQYLQGFKVKGRSSKNVSERRKVMFQIINDEIEGEEIEKINFLHPAIRRTLS